MSGSVFDGVLRKTLEVHCRECGQAVLGLPGNREAAQRELREDHGWSTRGGKWCCLHCLPSLPRGHTFEEVPA